MKHRYIVKSSIILTLGIIIGICGHSYTAKALGNIQSTGKLIYTNPETGEELIIDTNDIQLLKDDVDTNTEDIQEIQSILGVTDNGTTEGTATVITDLGNTPNKECRKSGNTVYINLRTYNQDSATDIDGKVIFNLPEEFRPSKVTYVEGTVNVNTMYGLESAIPTKFAVYPDGNVTHVYGGSCYQVWITDTFVK